MGLPCMESLGLLFDQLWFRLLYKVRIPALAMQHPVRLTLEGTNSKRFRSYGRGIAVVSGDVGTNIVLSDGVEALRVYVRYLKGL